ncbi:hypothetical protein [Tepidimicrobium xylanilyticum]|uniref:Uncharacterized protein n=1 Tax=Tepidimicrobium xylanilyticum TaxID=1123352 RepID=A0A1H3EET2_9FIRM|nr:hypothetical protein [Tepidimicrobium xylanilyticum]SDX77211.1 hypothetical protein SAMN05660923_02906 [Tepidimicrobium xylanilyticum]
MGRKPKLSKEVKAKVFREYEESNVNFNDIAKGIRAHHEVL